MPTLQIRDLPQELYDGLKNAAEQSRRSMTQEVIHILHGYLAEKQVEATGHLRKLDALERIKELKREIKVKLTNEEIVEMIREYRDR